MQFKKKDWERAPATIESYSSRGALIKDTVGNSHSYTPKKKDVLKREDIPIDLRKSWVYW